MNLFAICRAGGLGSCGLVVNAVGVHPVVEVEPWDIRYQTTRQSDKKIIKKSVCEVEPWDTRY